MNQNYIQLEFDIKFAHPFTFNITMICRYILLLLLMLVICLLYLSCQGIILFSKNQTLGFVNLLYEQSLFYLASFCSLYFGFNLVYLGFQGGLETEQAVSKNCVWMCQIQASVSLAVLKITSRLQTHSHSHLLSEQIFFILDTHFHIL